MSDASRCGGFSTDTGIPDRMGSTYSESSWAASLEPVLHEDSREDERSAGDWQSEHSHRSWESRERDGQDAGDHEARSNEQEECHPGHQVSQEEVLEHSCVLVEDLQPVPDALEHRPIDPLDDTIQSKLQSDVLESVLQVDPAEAQQELRQHESVEGMQGQEQCKEILQEPAQMHEQVRNSREAATMRDVLAQHSFGRPVGSDDMTATVNELRREGTALRQAVFDVQEEAASLRSLVDDLREEGKALRECLISANVVRAETLSARLHKQHFAAAQQAHPDVWDRSLLDVLSSSRVCEIVGLCAGLDSVCSVLPVDYPFAQCMAHVEAQLRKTYDKIYVFGGLDGQACSNTAERFDPCLCAWEPLPPMVQARQGAASAVVKWHIYVCGGTDGTRSLRSVEHFDSLTKEWNTMPMMLQARHYATAVGIDNDFFVCGGDNGQQPLKSVETYDPNTKAWREMAPMLQERYGAASAAVKGNIYVCGGRSAFRVQNCLRTAERYSPEKGWEPLPPMLQPRFRAAASVVDDDLFLLGGTNMHQSLSSVEQFDQLTNIWASLPAMPQRLYGATAANVAGCLFICGGHDGSKCVATAESFDPALKLWRGVSPMAQSRVDAVAASVVSNLRHLVQASDNVEDMVFYLMPRRLLLQVLHLNFFVHQDRTLEAVSACGMCHEPA
eukprot:CAMPEP_0194511082 /NCGR_PEP_ID=MMETSP0253-20130528/42644_1 /TAXON_ID=2966 /ORGANISM="Noctiluca scintillans" /LENGTH=671 /DNA_ID=CAMNT_0039354389 /DNA_START=81 /DNA_END=2095 /DNA_ORIENTATION=+